MDKYVREVVRIHPVDGWFEVRGTRDKPVLTRIAYWAHIHFGHRDPHSGEIAGSAHVVVGITGYDVPMEVGDYLIGEQPTGYIHINDLLDGREIPFSMINQFTWDE